MTGPFGMGVLAPTKEVPASSIVGWDAGSGGDGSQLSWNAPFSGVARAANDILVVHWTGTNFSNTVPSAPSGWTKIAEDRTGSNNPTALYGKVASGSETTATWGGTAAGYRWLGLIIRGGSSWANGACAGDSAATSNKTPATVNGIGASDMRLQLVTANQASGTFGKTGAAWSNGVAPQIADPSSDGTLAFGACYSIGSGASPSFQWNSSSTIFWGTSQLVIRP